MNEFAQAEYIYQTLIGLKVHLVKRLKERRDDSACDLTMPQSNTMLMIRQHGAVTMRQLSEALGVAPPSATSMVDRLVEMGMLQRDPCPGDRRTVRVRLTDMGESRLAEMESVMLGAFSELIDYLGPELSGQWLKVHERVRAWMAEAREGHGNDSGNETVESGRDG